jgi:NAD(P)-dependent dehydrogenase (short-subunit alcohol dehydrogenase family)
MEPPRLDSGKMGCSSATKGAVDSIARGLGIELAARKVRVDTIAPGGVETEGAHRVGMIGSDFEKQIVADTPMGRLGQSEDIARVAVFLTSDNARWLTGRELRRREGCGKGQSTSVIFHLRARPVGIAGRRDSSR